MNSISKFLISLVLVIPLILWGQEADTLISSDGIEFKESRAEDEPVSTGSDGLLEIPEDLIFEEGTSSSETAESPVVDTPVQPVDASAEGKQSLWGIFIAGLLGGFAAFIMPCIFPMVPLTVSFFTKKGGSRAKGVSQALLYGLFIIVIYVALGMLITIAFGSDALNALSTNGVFNFLFFLILVIFAASFFGAFELTLPSSFVNK